MSFKLGMIVSDDCDNDKLKMIIERFEQNRKRFEGPYPEDYCLYLKKTKNSSINYHKYPDEIFLEVSKYHDTGVFPRGSWSYYLNDLKLIRERELDINKENDSDYISRCYHLKQLEKSSKIWIDLIKYMRTELDIKKVAIFSYMIQATAHEMQFEQMKRIECKLEDLTMKYLMEMEKNTLVYFI